MAHENNFGLFDMSGTNFDIEDIERILKGFEENGIVEGSLDTGAQTVGTGETQGTHQSGERVSDVYPFAELLLIDYLAGEWLDALLGNIGSQGFETEDGHGTVENFMGPSFEDFVESLQMKPSGGLALDIAAQHPLQSLSLSANSTAASAISHLTGDNDLATFASGTGAGAFDPEQASAATVDTLSSITIPTYVDNAATLPSEASRHNGSVIPIPNDAVDASVFGHPFLTSMTTFEGPYQPNPPVVAPIPLEPYTSSTFPAPHDNGYSIPYLTPPTNVLPSSGLYEDPFFNVPLPQSQVDQAYYQNVPWVPPAEIPSSSLEALPASGYGYLPNNTFDAPLDIRDDQSGCGLQIPQATNFLGQPPFDQQDASLCGQQVLVDPPSQPQQHHTVQYPRQLPRECASPPQNVSISQQNAPQSGSGPFVPEQDNNVHKFRARPCKSRTRKRTRISLNTNKTDNTPVSPSSSSQVASTSAKAGKKRARATDDSDERTARSAKRASGSAKTTIDSTMSKPSLVLEEQSGIGASTKYACHWSLRRSSFCALGSDDEVGRMSHITIVHRAKNPAKGQFNCFWGGCTRNHRDGGEGFKKWRDLKKHLADEHGVKDGSKVHAAEMRALGQKKSKM
ncbi:hypothetical protein VNI00_006484 [Paramarasmius palmivorus]|uniref:C2H2-type domain-containing protein n=1 Tax=Paramarasmius palmivorus TaxID=297713 RepID=A0AAW0D5H5_9AGAR